MNELLLSLVVLLVLVGHICLWKVLSILRLESPEVWRDMGQITWQDAAFRPAQILTAFVFVWSGKATACKARGYSGWLLALRACHALLIVLAVLAMAGH